MDVPASGFLDVFDLRGGGDRAHPSGVGRAGTRPRRSHPPFFFIPPTVSFPSSLRKGVHCDP